jgi:hypothetical protein
LLKFVSDRFSRQKIAFKKARMEFRIKFMIPFNHRIEEVKSGRRFPKSNELILTETPPRRCAKNVLPPGDKIFGVNPLHVPDGRLAGDRALRIRHMGLPTAGTLGRRDTGTGKRWGSGVNLGLSPR